MSLGRWSSWLTALVLVLGACGGGDDTGLDEPESEPSATTTTTQADQPTTTESEEQTSTTAASMDGVHVSDGDLGEILVSPDGFTLYVFTNDPEGSSVCNGGCADLWPPVPADTPIGSDVDAGLFGSATRDDGTEQLTVNGMPLYLYQPDTSPGDTKGQGFNDVWFVVGPGGQMIQSTAESEDVGTDDSVVDYDY